MAREGARARFAAQGVDSRSFVGVFAQHARVAADAFTREVAEELQAYLVEVIESQRYKWKPLSEAYKDSKRRKGLDDRIYIATGFFLKSITVWEDKSGIHVGFEPGTVHPGSGMDIAVLARILEFGSARAQIPARPLWRPAISAVRRRRKNLQRRLRISATRAAQEAKKRAAKVNVDIRGRG